MPVSVLFEQFLTKCKYSTHISPPPFIPDLQLHVTIFLFPKLKIHQKNNRFENMEDIERNTTTQLHVI